MVRGLYTGASGMIAQMERIATISNNLANVNTTAYKKEEVIMKEFPQMLIRRYNDKVVVNEMGSFDLAPIVGKLGTGVEINEKFINYQLGNLVKTDNKLDFAIINKGFFKVETPYGIRYTRNGELDIDVNGFLVTKDGYKIIGENGYINLKNKDFYIDKSGRIWAKEFFQQKYKYVDTIPFYIFPDIKYLEKTGNSFYRETQNSGPAQQIPQKEVRLQIGYIEASNVNPITEMVKLIDAQREYEANSKSVQAADDLLNKSVNTIAKI